MPKQQHDHPGGRRSHKKSRNGCAGCKRRHIKCDETRPECRNCVMSDRVCSFLKTDPDEDKLPSGIVKSPSPPRSTVANAAVVPEQLTNNLQGDSPTFTVAHMAFLHHAESHMADFMALRGDVRPIINTAIEHAFTAPYLLNELLALSALHLSTQGVAQARLFSHQATELQTRSLELFAEAKGDISESTYMPMFMFASLLGIHVLYETLKTEYGTLADFVKSFVSYCRLHRGVRAVTGQYWSDILQSDLKPLLYIATLSKQTESQAPGTETDQLREFFTGMATSSAATEACLRALAGVQWVLDMAKQEPTRFDVGVHAVMAWPLYVTDGYVEALHQHQPEALVVLAFYAATLHRYRQYWAFGSSGSSVVHLVASSIGSFWQDMLSWPLQVLTES
ncbi:C6 finger domain-containing protein [Colletotrichum kahawae]|uniref:C6 finger domain-containing protein n=1 Tax=Colletotrichum kahawae TaxID=34407 RepID=A0AAE0D6Y3_COLKA|nr:C6 finger domain-containing protein [Colletotrichum kahawae]